MLDRDDVVVVVLTPVLLNQMLFDAALVGDRRNLPLNGPTSLHHIRSQLRFGYRAGVRRKPRVGLAELAGPKGLRGTKTYELG